jgi:ABC-2 type transport system ATP-binding protein
MKPTSGSITYFGQDFVKNRSEIAQQINFASAYSKLPGKLTIAENLAIYAQLYGLSATDRRNKIEHLLKFFGMWHIKDKLTGNLSAGQTTRVLLAKAFLNDPQVVLLDEPTASLDPDICYEVRHFILEQQRERNISILYTSHNMAEVAEICDRVLILKAGNIIADSTPEQLAASVAQTRVDLMVSDDLEKAKNYAALHNFLFTIKENHTIQITVDEHNIAALLAGLASNGILYTQISIEKPTLEDYFLQVSRDTGV